MTEFRFSRESLAHIRSLALAGYTLPQIATQLGAARSTIFNICRDHGITVTGPTQTKTVR